MYIELIVLGKIYPPSTIDVRFYTLIDFRFALLSIYGLNIYISSLSIVSQFLTTANTVIYDPL